MTIREAMMNSLGPEEVRKGEEYLKGKKAVYLCLPFDGDMGDYVEKAGMYFDFAESEKCALMLPYLTLIALGRAKIPPRLQIAREVAMEMLDACDEFWVTRDVMTENVLVELCQAVRKNLKIRYIKPMKEEEVDE